MEQEKKKMDGIKDATEEDSWFRQMTYFSLSADRQVNCQSFVLMLYKIIFQMTTGMKKNI